MPPTDLLAAELVDVLVESGDGLLELPLAGGPELLEVRLHGLQVVLELRLYVVDVRGQAGEGLLKYCITF